LQNTAPTAEGGVGVKERTGRPADWGGRHPQGPKRSGGPGAKRRVDGRRCWP